MRRIHFTSLPLLIAMAASPVKSEWTVLENPGDQNLKSLWFTDASTGFMLGASAWRTDDGAATWKKMELPSGNYHEIRFRDARTGFIAGTGSLLKTTDGGKQWQPIGVYRTFQDLNLIGEVLYAVDRERKDLWKSSDGGFVWDSVGDMGTWVGDISFPDSQTGFLASARDIYKSTDGGRQWRKVYSLRIGGQITDIQFLNPDTGYASAFYSGSVLSTYDGGETWNEVASNIWLYGIHFSDTRHGCATGSAGDVMRTADAGATWTLEATGSRGPFRLAHFPTADVGYVLGPTALVKFSNPSLSIRPASSPILRVPALSRFFDIRGARLSRSN